MGGDTATAEACLDHVLEGKDAAPCLPKAGRGLGTREPHPAWAQNLYTQALVPDTRMCQGTELVQRQKPVNETGSVGGHNREEACKATGKERG